MSKTKSIKHSRVKTDERQFLTETQTPAGERQRLQFGHVTDSPQEAVQIILRSLPPAVRKQLKSRVK